MKEISALDIWKAKLDGEYSGSETWKVTGTIAVAVIQKDTEYGYLTVSIRRDGKVLDSQTTTAAYGVVSVSASG